MIGHRQDVLKDGLVQLVDVMGDDAAIVQAARVSYGEGTKTKREDRGLIRYLMRHYHTTPFEMCEVKFLVRAPMDVWRQWIRHRTACLTGDMEISFDLPSALAKGTHSHYALTVRELYDKFQPTKNQRPDRQRNPYHKRNRVQGMCLRSVNEDTGEVYHTQLRDIWSTGTRLVLRVQFSDGQVLRATGTHQVFTEEGWLLLREALESGVRFAALGKTPTPVREATPFTRAELAAEEWRPVPGGYEALYEVSDLGRVRRIISKWGNPLNPPRMKKLTPTGADGRLVVGLSGGPDQVSTDVATRTKAALVHRLVLEAFVGPAPEGMEGRHLDNCAANNRVSNLAWGTPQENADDRMRGDGNQRLGIRWVDVAAWEEDGEEETFDIAVAGPYHNFIANGLVVHNSVNEYSTRYSLAIDSAHTTGELEWRTQSSKNKQGSGGMIPPPLSDQLTEEEAALHEHARRVYEARIDAGVAREQARKDLPLSTYTEAYWKIDLHNLFHFLRLRMDSHAQFEIREYAHAIAYFVSELFPLAWEAFEDYRLNAVTLSAGELAIIRMMCAGQDLPGDGSRLSNREREELLAKLGRSHG